MGTATMIRVDRTIDRIRLHQTPANIYQGFCRPVEERKDTDELGA
jgi:hypothetical protein